MHFISASGSTSQKFRLDLKAAERGNRFKV